MAKRENKGHPLRQRRRARAAVRLAAHTYNAERCGPNCPKRRANQAVTAIEEDAET